MTNREFWCPGEAKSSSVRDFQSGTHFDRKTSADKFKVSIKHVENCTKENYFDMKW